MATMKLTNTIVPTVVSSAHRRRNGPNDRQGIQRAGGGGGGGGGSDPNTRQGIRSAGGGGGGGGGEGGSCGCGGHLSTADVLSDLSGVGSAQRTSYSAASARTSAAANSARESAAKPKPPKRAEWSASIRFATSCVLCSKAAPLMMSGGLLRSLEMLLDLVSESSLRAFGLACDGGGSSTDDGLSCTVICCESSSGATEFGVHTTNTPVCVTSWSWS